MFLSSYIWRTGTHSHDRTCQRKKHFPFSAGLLSFWYPCPHFLHMLVPLPTPPFFFGCCVLNPWPNKFNCGWLTWCTLASLWVSSPNVLVCFYAVFPYCAEHIHCWTFTWVLLKIVFEHSLTKSHIQTCLSEPHKNCLKYHVLANLRRATTDSAILWSLFLTHLVKMNLS